MTTSWTSPWMTPGPTRPLPRSRLVFGAIWRGRRSRVGSVDGKAQGPGGQVEPGAPEEAQAVAPAETRPELSIFEVL